MVFYYFDIETTGLSPVNDEVICITFQEINLRTGKSVGPLRVLKSWESSEKDIITAWFNIFFNNWKNWNKVGFGKSFVPVGTNLVFEKRFFYHKLKKYSLIEQDFSFESFINDFPVVDIKSLLVLLGGGSFKKSSLHNWTKKKTDGKLIPEHFKNKEFEKIEEYILIETEAFIEFIDDFLKKNVIQR